MLINLTPHTVNFVDGPAVPPSGTVARVNQTTERFGSVDGVNLVRATFGDVIGLPFPVDGTIFIVSAMVRAACTNRDDLASPGDLVRDAAGAVIGCNSLIVN